MVWRVLLVVLIAAGPVPVRFCNCTAAAALPSNSDLSGDSGFTGRTVVVRKTCSCKNHIKANETLLDDQRTGHHEGCELHDADQFPSSGHDKECPAVKPRVTMSDAVVPPVTDVPVDYAIAALLDSPLSNVNERLRASFPLRPILPSVPLFIAFLNLRN